MHDDRHRSDDPQQPRSPQQRPSSQLSPSEERRLRGEEQRVATAREYSAAEKVIEVIYYLTGALGILLLLRFVLKLFGANPDNAFAQFIYNLSTPFIGPFVNLFPTPAIGELAVLEITVLIAIAVYALLTWLVVRLIRIIWMDG